MATFAQIKEIRLKLHEPIGFINIIEAETELPATGADQTLYTIKDSGVYQQWKTGAWKTIKLNISDEQIGLLIDLYGVDKATIRVVQSIINALGQELRIAQQNDGVESIVYTNLTTLYNFYKGMKESLQEDQSSDAGTNTGRSFHTCSRPVGGAWEW